MKKPALTDASRPSRAPAAKDRVLDAIGGKQVRISLDVPEEIRRRVKTAASVNGVSVRDYIVKLIDEHVPKFTKA